MDIAILDLEWNAAYSRKTKSYINEIIEFGAVKASPSVGPADTFTCFVRPRVGKHLNAVVAEMTSITEENLTQGLDFMDAVYRFRDWLGDCLLMTWGSADVLTLIENCRYFSGDMRVPFLTSYCDLQRYAEICLDLDTGQQAGQEKVAGLLGVDLSQVDQHRALDDSLVALEIFRRIRDRADMAPFIAQCDEEFYRRMTFRTSFVRDLQDPRVKPEHLRFRCPGCGEKAARTGRWTSHNRAFKADFRCKRCGLSFMGRVIIKEKYEGISVNKKIFPHPIIEEPRDAVPGPVGNMSLKINSGVGVLRFPAWEDLGGFVCHAFSTRLGGVSGQEFASMNLGFNRGDPDENVEENYRRFCAAAGFEAESLVCGCQVHKTDIRRVGEAQRGIGIWTANDCESADGLCTNEPGVALVVYAADCVPVYFVDPEHKAIGLAHAGWRGAAAGMPEVMVGRMGEEFGTRPEALRAAIGPSICKECFEVDPPVAKVFLALPESECFVTGPVTDPAGQEKYHVDLWECCRRSLLRAGVKPENITVGGVCTMEESTLLFSHRKTRGQRGSNCAMLALLP